MGRKRRNKERPQTGVPAAQPEKSLTGMGYNLPVSGGFIPSDWPWNFWQQGRDPIGTPGRTAIVGACIAAYSQTIASLPGEHYRYTLPGRRGVKELVTTSALSRFLFKPNGYQTISDFLMNMVESLLRHGNAYAVAIRNDRNEIDSMHLMPSRATQPYVDPEERGIYYAVGDNPLIPRDISVMIPARDVFHLRLHTPRHPLIGVSPLENAVMSIATNAQISMHQERFFANMSRPSGVLSTDERLTREQMSALRAAWEAQASNFNTGNVPILAAGLKWQQIAMTSHDAEMISAFEMTVTDIARAFRVPLPLVNQNDKSTNYGTTEALIGFWLAGGLGFLLEHIESALEAFFGLGRLDACELNTDSLLRTDFLGRVESYSKLVQNGLLTPDEARERFDGLPNVEYGDRTIVQQQMVPLGWWDVQAITGQQAPDAQPADDPPAGDPPPDPDAEDSQAALESAAILQFAKRGQAA